MTRTIDPFDELASMFLTEIEEPAPERPERTAAGIEVVVVGHLPVRAALWLPPYADALAREAGAAALVRLDADEPMVQLLHGEDLVPRITESRNLREAILELGDAVRHWVIRPSSRSALSAWLDAQPDFITILSGVDQAAVVSAYRMIKDLVDAADDAGIDLPPIRLAVLGADQAGAEGMVQRLNRTTEECLDITVPLVMCLPRMDAAMRSSGLRSFPGQARPDLEEVVAWIDESRTSRVVPPGEAQSADDAESDMPIEQDEDAHDPEPLLTSEHVQLAAGRERGVIELERPEPTAYAEAVLERREEPEPRVLELEPLTPASRDEDAAAAPAESVSIEGTTPLRRIKLAPKPSMELEPKESAQPREPSKDGKPIPLASYVPGLRAMPTRAPNHERIELAVDKSGGLHLLGDESLVREMRVVTVWARAHRELLSMACPEHMFDSGRAIACHLFTADPQRVSDLYGSDVHLHILAPVDVDGKRGWYAALLYEPKR